MHAEIHEAKLENPMGKSLCTGSLLGLKNSCSACTKQTLTTCLTIFLKTASAHLVLSLRIPRLFWRPRAVQLVSPPISWKRMKSSIHVVPCSCSSVLRNLNNERKLHTCIAGWLGSSCPISLGSCGVSMCPVSRCGMASVSGTVMVHLACGCAKRYAGPRFLSLALLRACRVLVI